MKVRLVGKHLEITDRLREHFEKRLERLGRYYKKSDEAHVVLKKEKYLYIVEVTVQGKGFQYYGEGRSEANFYAALEEAESKVEVQLKRKKERVKDYKVFLKRESRLKPSE